jgi:hypothetical protein
MTLRPLVRPIAAALASVVLAVGAAHAAKSADSWQVVLIAGDRSEPVFDNAARDFGEWLVAHGVPEHNISRFSAAFDALGTDIGAALKSTVLRHIEAMQGPPGYRCLVFMTSHGQQDGGFYLALNGDTLSPDELAAALAQGCGRAPTIVIASSCFSGGFATGAMAQPNRIILTASRADRPSFGCQSDRTYTFFDQCLLGALPKAHSWHTLYAGTSACVGRTERERGAPPSEPQAFFGDATSKLSLWFPSGSKTAQ